MMSKHDAKQDAEWRQILLIFASSTRPHLDQGEAPKRGIFNDEYKKIKECPRKLTRVQKQGDISSFFGRKIIINKINCTCFWCPPNPSPKVLIARTSLPPSLPNRSSSSGPQSSSIAHGKVVNPYAKLQRPINSNMPPRCKRPISPSKFRPLLRSPKSPVVALHRAHQQSIPQTSPSNHSKNCTVR
mmetsp:Transcript_8268/g.17629  ORF Transcript_8268/g.17629 Transcript_8268/m.17629 type:complete len:186 (+) Transcript_8268:112-669(+)